MESKATMKFEFTRWGRPSTLAGGEEATSPTGPPVESRHLKGVGIDRFDDALSI